MPGRVPEGVVTGWPRADCRSTASFNQPIKVILSALAPGTEVKLKIAASAEAL